MISFLCVFKYKLTFSDWKYVICMPTNQKVCRVAFGLKFYLMEVGESSADKVSAYDIIQLNNDITKNFYLTSFIRLWQPSLAAA